MRFAVERKSDLLFDMMPQATPTFRFPGLDALVEPSLPFGTLRMMNPRCAQLNGG